MSRVRISLVILLGSLALAACGHDHPAGDGALPVFDTETDMVKVTLPPGMNVSVEGLQIVTSVDAVPASGSGSAAVRVYSGNGSQLAIVLSPAGNPMLMGWIDSTHPTIDAATTADVLAYFALGGGTLLNSVDTQALIAGIPTASGIDTLAQAVQAELGANVDAFGQPDAKLAAAVSAFATPLFTAANSANAASASSGLKRIKALSISPDVQSGVTVLTIDQFSAALQNALRRRAYAFVDRISTTTAGTETPDPAPVTDFEVPPVVGVNGGVTGALTDIMNAYYGNQPTAYAPIIAPSSGSFATPLASNTDKTTYQITLVGPGASTAVAGTLTAQQSSALTDVAIRGFVKDFFVPTLANGFLGSGLVDFSAGQGTAKAKFLASVLTSFTTDFTAFLPTVPGVADKISQGQWKDAAVDLTATVAGSNSIRTLLVGAFTKASSYYAAQKWNPGAGSTFFQKFDVILNVAGGVLQAYDSTTYLVDLKQASNAVQWTLVATKAAVKINPLSSTVGVGGASALTASVLGVDSTAGYSYEWSTTTYTTDDLNEIGLEVGAVGRTHQTDYCSASAQTAYEYELNAVDGTVDTVTVKVWNSGNCGNGSGQYLGSAQATVTVQKNITVSITPVNPTVAPGATATFTASTQGTALPGNVTYQWTLSGTGSIGAANPVTTSVPTISYTAPTSGTDTLSVTILASDGTTLGTAQDTINITNPWVGQWNGSTVPTCGSYSGPQDFNITLVDATTLDFGPYQATFSGNSASVNGGEVVFTLSGNTITGYEADSCQTGTYTRQ